MLFTLLSVGGNTRGVPCPAGTRVQPFVPPAPTGTHFSLGGFPKENTNGSCRRLVLLSPLEQSSPSKLDFLLPRVAVREIKLFGVFVFTAQGSI